jgi:hypothetical protein
MDNRRAVLVARLAACLAGALAAGAARAAEPPPLRQSGIEIKNGQVTISVGLQDLFGPTEREHLSSGFATRVLIRAAVQDESTGEPIALAVQRVEIVYDIWDERFEVRATRGLGAEQRAVVPTADEAIWRATALVDFPLVDARRLRTDARYVVMLRGDLNPISEDLLVEVRRWLVQPARGERRLGAGDSFFGSFVSIFVNPRIEDSERQVRFVSQPFAPGRPTLPTLRTPTLPPPRSKIGGVPR